VVETRGELTPGLPKDFHVSINLDIVSPPSSAPLKWRWWCPLALLANAVHAWAFSSMFTGPCDKSMPNFGMHAQLGDMTLST
jgi:hypothetical protein